MIEFLNEITAAGILVEVSEGKLKLFSEQPEIAPDLLIAIKERKGEIIDYLQQTSTTVTSPTLKIPKAAPGSVYPLSDAQRRMWILNQYKGSSAAYNMPSTVELGNSLDMKAMTKALHAVIDRHEVLRTVFEKTEEDELCQRILCQEDLDFQVGYIDLTNPQTKVRSIEAYVAQDGHKTFDLEKGPLLRACIFKTTNERFAMYYNMHHIIGDAWSIKVLGRDVMAYYEYFAKGVAVKLPELKIQYKDYAVWQSLQLDSEQQRAQGTYWSKQLSGTLPVLDLPAYKHRPQVMSYRGEVLKTYLNPEITQCLKKFGQEQGGSLFMTLLAIWNVLLYRYSSQTDIIIGTPVAGRNHRDLEFQIGCYVNTLALRQQINPRESFADLYNKVKAMIHQAYAHQSYPFDRLIDDLGIPADRSRSVLFDVMLLLQEEEAHESEMHIEAEPIQSGEIIGPVSCIAKFDITLSFIEHQKGLMFQVIYNSDVYESEMVTNLIKHFMALQTKLMEQPEQKIEMVNFLNSFERKALIADFNGTEFDYPKTKSLVDLFKEQVASRPQQVALVDLKGNLTYQELDIMSDILAQCLVYEYNTTSDDFVAIKLPRGLSMIVAIIGVLKSGAAYVPMDVDYPLQRIQFIEEDSQCKTVIDVVAYQRMTSNTIKKEVKLPEVNSDNLAYVIYTSGSTGKPKGVMVEHRNVINLITYQTEKFGINSSDSFILFSSISFDASVEQIYLTLFNGARLYVPSKNELLDKEHFTRLLVEQEVTHIHAVPSFLRDLIPYTSSGIRRLVSGGELFEPSIFDNWFGRQVNIVNEYGPTETTVTSLEYFLNDDSVAPSVIGNPIANTQVYVMGEGQTLQPIGVPGELYIAGDGVARGYLNRPELTSERFLENPFVEGARMYKTGDLCRRLADGRIEFLGRIDDQVKVRGYRIELGEVMHALVQLPQVNTAVVDICDVKGDKCLVAYYTSAEQVPSTILIQQLSTTLPEYMLPSYYVQLEKIPLNANGKIDRRALPSPLDQPHLQYSYVPPSTETEIKLTEIWAIVLGVDNVGIEDNFFTIGGTSLKAVKVILKINRQLRVNLVMDVLFSYPRIVDLANYIETLQFKSDVTSAATIEIKKVEENDSYPLSDTQRRMWIMSQFGDGALAYHMPVTIELSQDIDSLILEKAIKAVIDRHEILRTVFVMGEGDEIRQRILDPETSGFSLGFFDLETKSNAASLVKNYIAEDRYKTFDFENGPLLRVMLFRISFDSSVLYYNMHHIVGDAWSSQLLAQEVMAHYEYFQTGKEIKLPALRLQYKDYTAWQLNQLQSVESERQKSYWLKILSGELPVLEFPGTKQRPQIKTYRGESLMMCIDREATAKLKLFSRKEGGSLFITLLSLWNVLLYRYSSQKDLIIGSPVTGRDHPDLEYQMGCYVNTLALRNKVDPEDSYSTFYQKVKAATLGAYAHQRYPFDRLIDELRVRIDQSRSPLFDVMLVLQEEVSLSQETDDELKIGEGLELAFAKFDLTIVFTEVQDRLVFQVTYNLDIYSQALVQDLMTHFVRLQDQLMRTPEQEVGKVNFLSDQEQKRLLEEFNLTEFDYPKTNTILDYFKEQVLLHPNRPAVVDSNRVLTYLELNEQSDFFASYLSGLLGIVKGDLVGLKLPRSNDIVIVILGILKCGAAYLPIDIDYPQARVDFIEQDSRCKVIIDHDKWANFQDNIFDWHGKLVLPLIDSMDLAYVIYTSGSTGKPKGVMIGHGNVVNLITYQTQYFSIDESDSFILFSSISFDASVEQLFLALFNGAKLYVPSKEELLSEEEFGRMLVEQQISHILAVPSFLRHLKPESAPYLRRLSSGGEAFDPRLVDPWKDQVQIINQYGPTETTVTSVEHFVKVDDPTPCVIGKPLGNTQCYILGDALALQPIGVAGELYIGGHGLSQGYLHREELTKERFIENPFVPGKRMYKTGDLCRWLPNGEIEFLGRVDYQVKIRGYRIELGEIEQYLLEIENISEVVVHAQESADDSYLVAYYISSKIIDSEYLVNEMKRKIPNYMVPSYFVALKAIPLNANGKIDKKALPEPAKDTKNTYVAPSNTEEKTLLNIWAKLLRYEKKKISVEDDFFDLGGHSLKLMALSTEIKKEFGIQLPMTTLFQATNIKAQAQKLMSLIQSEQRIIPDTGLILLKDTQESKQQLFLIHDGSGDTQGYMDLVDNINGYSIWGVNSDTLRFLAPQNIKLEVIAEKYVQMIKRTDPNGPYQILGWSHGGVIAYEMARQIEASGSRVDVLIMIDSQFPKADLVTHSFSGKKFNLKKEQQWINKFQQINNIHLPVGSTVKELWDGLVAFMKEEGWSSDKLREHIPEMFHRLIPNFELLEPVDLIRCMNTIRSIAMSVAAYVPQGSIEAKLYYIKAQISEFDTTSLMQYGKNDVIIKELEGDHFSLLQYPDVQELAIVLQSYLHKKTIVLPTK
ncbi:amino acid adenylation domain-containing protein [Aquimarina sp. MAR_2010_214]|uniref:non-ribosomal peptide synthetase n=1 Tax=Aquimarina sp. MAR_2010_214 TaxID=1250026 RepID=UPI000C7031BD|nr:non-ribosomal peptide synthetase [Aquimarina sp. MAR_2010_214]PKV49530.1 amino acid adenylation domain-containing protein [Aquimarina sp. MAR_2010_214]